MQNQYYKYLPYDELFQIFIHQKVLKILIH